MARTTIVETESGRSFKIESYNEGESSERHYVYNYLGTDRHEGTASSMVEALALIMSIAGTIKSIN